MTHLTPQQALDLAAQHRRAGRLSEAAAIYRRLLEIDPGNAGLFNVLGIIAQQSGALEDAADLMRRAIVLKPAEVSFYNNLGNILQDLSRFAEAESAYRGAIERGPEYAQPYTNLGNSLRAQGKWEEATEAYRHALQLDRNLPESYANLAAALTAAGNLDEAIGLYEHAINLPGHFPGLFDNYLATLHYRSPGTNRRLWEAHHEYDRRYCLPFRATFQPHHNSNNPERLLRLGFVSPHFAYHPVGYFLVRLLENLPRDQFDVVCYSDTANDDAMTSRLQAQSAKWFDIRSWSDEQLAQRIRQDVVDILFDLAGHTPGNRLLMFARKPAPIQITWLDYVGTTGLSAIDYIIADPRQIPAGSESYYTEKVLRLPHDYICFDPPSDAPPVNSLPALRKGFVTFASFNIVPKVSPEMIGIWACILKEVPESRLMLKNGGFDNPQVAARLRQQFVENSIDPERIVFEGWSPHAELLSMYNEVDIALDTFPYNGGLTTCEALWMGVPVVTCYGETFASRHGLTHLTAVGISETIVNSLADYVKVAAALARNLSELNALRAKLRTRVASSALCDGPEFAKNFAGLLREVWRSRGRDR